MATTITVYEFDDKYVDDVDGFTFNVAAWLGDSDVLIATPTATVTPTDATVESVAMSGPLVTVWVAGGVAGTTYTIEIEAITFTGRDCRIRGTFTVEA